MRSTRDPIYAIGHSTRTVNEFIKILKAYAIDLVVDIRTIPRSRHNPQFNKDLLPGTLKEEGIGYVHLPQLGGLRRTMPDSKNDAWKNASFRGFADYMQTVEFKKGLEKLIEFSKQKTLVIMCAEAVPWRCHRSLIEDALLAKGFEPLDIYNLKLSKKHKLTPWATIENERVTYPQKEEAQTEA